MRALHQEFTKQKIKPFKFKYSIPKEARPDNELFTLYGEQSIEWIGYADDIAMAFEDITNLVKGMKILTSVFSYYGLNINEDKTKTMTINS